MKIVELKNKDGAKVLPDFITNDLSSNSKINVPSVYALNSLKNIITARINTTQECPNSTTTNITLESAMNIGDAFELTNGRVVCKKKGYVMVNAHFTLGDLVVGGNTQPRIYHNSSLVMSVPIKPSYINVQGYSISPILIKVNVGDTLSLAVGNWSGSSNTAFTNNENTCLLTAEYLTSFE